MQVLRAELARTKTFRRAYSSSAGTQTTDGTSTGVRTPAEPETDEPSHNRERPEPSLAIWTLDPTRLTSAELLTIDSSTSVTVFSPNADSDTPECRLSFPKLTMRPGQRGWLYYHQPPSGPPLAGEVRFRIAASEDPGSFELGVDAVTRSGIPWCISLPEIAVDTSYAAFGHILTAVDRTVSRKLMNTTSQLSRIPKRCVHAFGQPFELFMEAGTSRVMLAGKQGLGFAELQNIAMAGVEAIPAVKSGQAGRRYIKHKPFLGTAVCAFERSARTDHHGQRVVVIRMLRSPESDPVRVNPNYVGPQFSEKLMPREGELLMMVYRGRVMPWVGDVDRKAAEGRRNPIVSLGILFDNATEYGLPSAELALAQSQ
ncbi:hypothetical protein K466DRAFT_589439 [Polyporus arcularius HHB13444]|uniref:Uncharacterized protein n=1 Tax=Polyporus arcularius HHB13444 TaxID=1314778 RepID=A0A5C3P6C5_9APHY|nr:hypothetical protein K466DRAFT_589439 [Polyporus arcularius HHB13444]